MTEKLTKIRSITATGYIYQMLCVTGLVWQVQQISVEYFEFSTVSSITIKMPGDEEAKALNVCFLSSEVLNYTKFIKIFNNYNDQYNSIPGTNMKWDPDNRIIKSYIYQNYFTVSERFSVLLMIDEALLYHPNYLGQPHKGRIFIWNDYTCYQIWLRQRYQFEWRWDAFQPKNEYDVTEVGFTERLTTSDFDYKNRGLINVTYTHAVLTSVGKFPWLEFYLTSSHKIKPMYKNQFFLSAHTYIADRLKWPYVDNCIDYAEQGFQDRDDAINECIDIQMIASRNKSYRMKIFKQRVPYLPAKPVDKEREKCTDRYQNKDCYTKILFTKINIRDQKKEKERTSFYYSVDVTGDPSFNIKSQAKIALIDFICYILGACGTWFGFSFLMLNPAPHLLSRINSKIKPSLEDQESVLSDISEFMTEMTSENENI